MLHALRVKRFITATPIHARRRMNSNVSIPRENRTYDDAIQHLNSLQSDPKEVEKRRKTGPVKYSNAIPEMKAWVRRLGYEPKDFNRLNVIHVAGTKGKGGTCAYVDSILNQHRSTTGLPRKVGLYTSPHLIAVRERIRINFAALSEDLFAKYFFEVWDALETSAQQMGLELHDKPIYFRYLTLMSFHVFMQEGVDAAIYEVGVGGELDSTNLIENPVATGITTLGIDHVEVLGDTIDMIAWHKAGIFKTGSPAFSVEQIPAATAVLQDRAKEKDVSLEIVATDRRTYDLDLTPNEDFQRRNASLAIRLAQQYLSSRGVDDTSAKGPLPEAFKKALQSVVWRGRCEIIPRGKQTWFIDGAHTTDSLSVAGKWFLTTVSKRSGPRIMIFNQQSLRNTVNLLQVLHRTLSTDSSPFHFDHVIFTTNITYKSKAYKSDFDNRNKDTATLLKLNDQNTFAATWKALDATCETSVVLSIEEAMERVDDISAAAAGDVQVFATGSLHLVGGVLFHLGETDATMGQAGRA